MTMILPDRDTGVNFIVDCRDAGFFPEPNYLDLDAANWAAQLAEEAEAAHYDDLAADAACYDGMMAGLSD